MGKSKYAILIFLGACSYGILTAVVKVAIQAGYSVQEITGSQYLFSFLALLILLPFFQRKALTKKQGLQLILTGSFLSLTGLFYGLSLKENPASVSVVLLFQFTWIGILLEACAEKRWPSPEKLIAIVFLLIGTGFAGQFSLVGIQKLESTGVVYGLLAALTYALFIFFTGKVATELPGLQRSTYLTFGGLLLVLITSSGGFITSGVIFNGLWKYALITGFFAVLPIICFAFGSPKLDSGLATIVSSAELPASIVAALLILHESFSTTQLFGIILILSGIFISQFPFQLGRKKHCTNEILNR
ncbi:EamA family transporter [Bacillus marasmi]|uniref:EamA family transporter n=1 Tax=Bacillus marasmi TaxID=1926279 RepID=UPI0011C8AA13|nr:DMT family transporter [Bacillus marasmi]